MGNAFEDLRQAIVEGDDEAAPELARAALQGATATEVLNGAIVPGIDEAGRLWSENKYFLPDVILSAGAFKAATAIVQPLIEGGATETRGRVVIGVVQGDMHDLGKTIVSAMLSGAGFEVVDLGVDVPAQTFVDKVRELQPDIVGLGAYMTTTMLQMRGVIAGLEAAGLRESVRVFVGGVPLSQKFADEIGADAWGKDALQTVAKAREVAGVA